MKNNSVSLLLSALVEKKSITEIMINGVNKVFVENKGEVVQLKADLNLEDINEFIRNTYKLNNKNYDDHFILDGVLRDGSRVNIIRTPFVKNCPAITIRKYIKKINHFNPEKEYFGVNKSWHMFFKSLINSRCNIIISGGTGVGKTTFLNSMINEVDISERIITIEDTFELDVSLPNVVKMVSGRLDSNEGNDCLSEITIGDLVKSSLRMRPDRIIVGETRGGELFDLLQAMNTGHSGSMSSLHANSAKDTISRMENLFLMSGHSLDSRVVRRQIATTIDFIIFLNKDKNKNRIIESVMEITGMEGVNVLTNQIAYFDQGKLKNTGLVPERINRLVEDGGLDRSFFK